MRGGDPVTSLESDARLEDDHHEHARDNEEPRMIPNIEDSVDPTSKVANKQPFYGMFVNAEVELQVGDLIHTVKVIVRLVAPKGAMEDSYDKNPMLNSLLYDVEFPNGQVKEHSDNVAAENVMCIVRSDGFLANTLKAITCYSKDDFAVGIHDEYFVAPTGIRRFRNTTKGCKFKFVWTNVLESWLTLKALCKCQTLHCLMCDLYN